MPRAKKYEISDMELVKRYQLDPGSEESNKALHQMWDRYAALRNKMKHELIRCAMSNKMRMQEYIDEYDSRAWEKFINAMNSIRPKDSAHIENWKLYIQLWGYWRSMNRDIIHEFIKDSKSKSMLCYNQDDEEISIIDQEISRSGVNQTEDSFDNKMRKEIFWNSIKSMKSKLTAKQKILLAYKNKGDGKGKICKMLGISGKTYDLNMMMIKRFLVEAMKSESMKNRYEVNYGDFL